LNVHIAISCQYYLEDVALKLVEIYSNMNETAFTRQLNRNFRSVYGTTGAFCELRIKNLNHYTITQYKLAAQRINILILVDHK
jgi:hypothetical protein